MIPTIILCFYKVIPFFYLNTLNKTQQKDTAAFLHCVSKSFSEFGTESQVCSCCLLSFNHNTYTIPRYKQTGVNQFNSRGCCRILFKFRLDVGLRQDFGLELLGSRLVGLRLSKYCRVLCGETHSHDSFRGDIEVQKEKKEQSCYIHHSTTETVEGLKILGGNSNEGLYKRCWDR